MKTPDERTLIAMKALRGNPHFTVYLQWLKDSLAEQDEMNRGERNDVALRQGQGRAQQIEDTLKQVAAASDTADKIRTASERRGQDEGQY